MKPTTVSARVLSPNQQRILAVALGLTINQLKKRGDITLPDGKGGKLLGLKLERADRPIH